MAVEILVRPLTGRQEIDGRVVDDCDCGVDEVCIVSKEYPVPKSVGLVGRDHGAPVCLTAQVSESEQKAIEKAVADARGVDAVSVKQAPVMEDEE